MNENAKAFAVFTGTLGVLIGAAIGVVVERAPARTPVPLKAPLLDLHYLQRVEFVGSFYKGCKGIVEERYGNDYEVRLSDHCNSRIVLVKADSTNVKALED